MSPPSARATAASGSAASFFVVGLIVVAALAGCSDDVPPAPRGSREPSSSAVAAPAANAAPSVLDAWASHVGQAPLAASAPVPPPSAAATEAPRPSIEPAIIPDTAFAESGSVPARHLVYRVSFVVPPALRVKRPSLLAPAGELHVDVAHERLRARFVGPGWPLDDGTEIRLRADVPGVYVFDGLGGRPLPPGQLAAWFQGMDQGRAKTNVRVRRDLGSGDHGPGDLLCALLAEWTQQEREELLPRCQHGALPLGFFFGLWSAELTAIVPLKLSRDKLRADGGHPPDPVVWTEGRTMLEAADVGRLRTVRVRPEQRVVEANVGPEGAALEVENRSDSRVVVVIDGVPIGWVRARASRRFSGFRPGFYRAGAVRPLGQPATSPTLVHIPGALRIGPRATPPDVRRPQLAPPLPTDSPAATR